MTENLDCWFFNEIEKIEVALRSVMTNTASEFFKDVFWITKAENFKNKSHFSNSLKEISSELNKSKEEFINHFHKTYCDTYPPAWMIAEIIPLGNLCRIYKNILNQALKKKIASQFGLQPIAFESWIMTIAGLRNICCHHSRLWNRVLPLNPAIPQHTKYDWIENPLHIDIQRVYFRLCIIQYLLITISPKNSFKQKISALLEKYPTVDIYAMGFPKNWHNEPLWQSKTIPEKD